MGIRQVGGVTIQARHWLECHCGCVVPELELPQGIVNPRRCDCSICRRKGAILASVSLDGIRIVQGGEYLQFYQFNTGVAKPYFCSICGIYTHHQRRSFPDQYGYNVGCLEVVNPFLIPDVPVNDGVHHPADRTSSGAPDAKS
ncbi:MAG: GFA family protein [Burkholderiaceae bacterium]